MPVSGGGSSWKRSGELMFALLEEKQEVHFEAEELLALAEEAATFAYTREPWVVITRGPRRGAAWMWPKEGWPAQHGARERRGVSLLVETTTGVHRGGGGTWGAKIIPHASKFATCHRSTSVEVRVPKAQSPKPKEQRRASPVPVVVVVVPVPAGGRGAADRGLLIAGVNR
jgi:hypothetical protein